MTPTRFRIRPFEVDAIQWTGRPYGFLVQRLQALAGDDMFDVIDEAQRPYMDDPGATASYRDHDRGGTWQPVYNGDWIVRRLDTGKVFRLPDEAFRATYEPLPYTVDEAGVHVYERVNVHRHLLAECREHRTRLGGCKCMILAGDEVEVQVVDCVPTCPGATT